MNSRKRLIETINHREPERLVFDLGATSQTGISASTLYRLRKALGLEERAVKVHEPAQMLGEVEKDLMDILGVDVIGLWNPQNILGVKNTGFKNHTMPDKTPVKVAGGLEFSTDEKNNTYTYPQGDKTVPPSMIMPEGGYFFDNIERSPDFDEENLDPKKDYGDDFGVFQDSTALFIEKEAKRLHEETEYGIVGMCGGGGFGDVFMLPACWKKNTPAGIRKTEDWLMAHIIYPEYILEVFEMQLNAALKNLEIYKQACGDKIQVVWIGGTDFGTQNGPFISPETYKKLYKPFHKKINDWVHKNTNWKTFYHSCGSIVPLLDDFHEAGIDILNPVQVSAAGMDPKMLKEKYGDKFVFWGGGVDTQQTLPFGTPEQVKKQVSERIDIFSKGGGYVFNTIHNIVGKTPVENIMGMLEVLENKRR